MSSFADILLLVVLVFLVLIYMRLGRLEQMLARKKAGGPPRLPGRGKVVPYPQRSPDQEKNRDSGQRQ